MGAIAKSSMTLQQPREPPVLTVSHFALDEQAQTVFEGQALGGTLGELLGQGDGHAVELQLVQ